MSEKEASAKEKKLNFEQALDRLEKIVAEMESGDLPLAESMKRFEEGTRLSEFCTKKLGETEKKIEILVSKNKDSEPEWENFEDGPGESASVEDGGEEQAELGF